jgi:hypothetical protein
LQSAHLVAAVAELGSLGRTMASVISWAEIVGTGIAGALIAYPLMYIALANRYKARLTNFANLLERI